MGQGPVSVHHDIPWLPPGSFVEVWLGDVPTPDDLCTSAFALPFMDDGNVLFTTVLKRGLDIPGGHVEPTDADPEAAAVRETLEETGATVRVIGKVGHLRIVVPDPPDGYRYPPESYQPFYAAVVEETGPVLMPQECGPPTSVPPDVAAADARFALHRDIILAASAMFGDLAPSSPANRA